MPDLTDAELYNIALATYCSLENEQTDPTDFMLDDEITEKYCKICEDDKTFEEVMKKSVKKLMTLPGDTKVYPGHGDFTTIVRERENNMFAW